MAFGIPWEFNVDFNDPYIKAITELNDRLNPVIPLVPVVRDPTIAVLVEENERLRTDNEHLRATLQTMEARRSSEIEHLPCVTKT